EAVEQNADNTIAAGREPTLGSTDQIATGQEQITRNTDRTSISVDQVPAAKASNVTVETGLIRTKLATAKHESVKAGRQDNRECPCQNHGRREGSRRDLSYGEAGAAHSARAPN